MNKVISWLKNGVLRQIVTVVLVAVSVFVIQFFGTSNALQAQADTVKSSEGIYYKGTPDYQGNTKDNDLGEKVKQNLKETTDGIRENLKTPEGTYYKGRPDYSAKFSDADDTETGNILDKAKQNLEKTAEDVKEKLNLDEPVPQSTKDFFQNR
jgi:translation initiation factor 2 alpha subunit (eIF-2alpha)